MAPPMAGLLDRIAALRPTFEANATTTESDRRVVEENITALREVGAFKVTVPARYGGYQSTIKTKLQVSREVAMGCGSTGWVTALMNVCAFFTALMSEQAQDDVWGANPDARVAGVFNPTSTSTKVDGGYMVTGSWPWASGCLHADWSFVGVPLFNEAGEFMYPAMALIPNTDVTIEETWFTRHHSPKAVRCNGGGETAKSPVATPSGWPKPARSFTDGR